MLGGGRAGCPNLNAKKRPRDSPNQPCPVDARHRLWTTGLTQPHKPVRRKAVRGYRSFRRKSLQEYEAGEANDRKVEKRLARSATTSRATGTCG